MAPVATAVLLIAALIAAPASAQRAGEDCGPIHGADDHWRWIAVPSSRLAATKGNGAVAGVDGCATSDRGPFAHVSAQLPPGIHHVHAVSFRASGAAGTNLTILAGSANTTAHVKEIRGGKAAEVLQHFPRCVRRSFDPADRRHTFNCHAETHVEGQWVVLFADALTVCNVLVCANVMEFTPDGVPLTSAATLRITPNFAVDGGAARLASTASRPAATLETCAGFTTQDWGRCPQGKECTGTYKPGDAVCACFKCSLFTNVVECEQGDTYIGSYPCCSPIFPFCQRQNVCARCSTPCNPEFKSIEVIPGVLPTKPSDINSLSYSYNATTQAINRGANAQTVTVTFSISQQMTASLSYAEQFQFSEKASFKFGVPLMKEGNLEFGATQTFTTTTTVSEARTTTFTTALQQQIPPMTMQDVTASARADTITTRVPVTIKTTYTCNKTETKETFALIKTEGTLSATAAQLTVTYGPQYPIEPPIVYGQANATCASNPTCSDNDLRVGNCCPDDNGIFKPCCSFCAFKPSCKDMAIDNTTMCCPSRTNRWNPCCGVRP